jgi:hypothetical protein
MAPHLPKHVWLKHFGIVPVLDRDLDDVAEYERQYRMFGMVKMDAVLGDTSANRARAVNAGEGVDAPISEDRLPYYERRRRELHRIYETPEVQAELEERRRQLADMREKNRLDDLEAWRERQSEIKRVAKIRGEYLAEKKRRDEEWEARAKGQEVVPTWNGIIDQQRALRALRVLREKRAAILMEWLQEQEKNDDSKESNEG